MDRSLEIEHGVHPHAGREETQPRMLGLFSGANAAAAVGAQQRPSGAGNAAGAHHKRRNNNIGSGKASTAAPTIAASDVLMTADGSAPTRSIHAFNAPEAETVLGLRRLLVKVVGAKDLPESVGARRSCSAEVQLVSELGSALPNGVLNDRTGPPNHFTTVKDTAPVWNAEFVAELPSDLQTHSAALRFAVYDDAASPPARLGEAYIHGSELERLCMREEERVLVLEHSTLPGASGHISAAAAAAQHLPTVRVRLALVDVRAAMGLLSEAAQSAAHAEEERAKTEERGKGLEMQLKILSSSMREEEERAAFFHQEAQRSGPLGGAAAIAAREREDARVKKAQEDAATLIAALKEEKRQGLEAVVAMHNTSLVAFKDDLAAHAAEAKKLQAETAEAMKADAEHERADLERQREEARALAFENAEQVIEAVESNARAEIETLQEQHVSALGAMQAQLGEQLRRERKAMEEELESRSRLLAMQITELKAAHAQQLADMKASMTATIEDYEQSGLETQKAAREEVRQAVAEHESQLRALRQQLVEAAEGPSVAEEQAKRALAAAEAAASEAAAQHEKEVAFVKETLKRRSAEQQAALVAMGARLEERGEALEKARTAEVEELKAELSQREVQHTAAHKEELTALKASYNDSIDRLKAEMLALIEERAASAETSKREYEAQLLAAKRLHLDEQEKLRQSLLEQERDTSRKHEAVLIAKVSEYESAVNELRESTLAAFAEEQRQTDGALPRLQERLETAAREHERAASELLASTEEKLKMQAELHSGEFEAMKARYEHALGEARATGEAALQQLDTQSQAREVELVRRLEQSATESAAELEQAGAKAEEAMALAMAKAREEREAAVEQCNAHWMGMVGRQSAEAARMAEAAEQAHSERLAVEVAKVAALEEAAMKQVEESSTKLREVEEALRKSASDELAAASHRHERLLKQSVAKLQQEMSLRLEEERRRWQAQAEVQERAAQEQRAQALSMVEEQHRAQIELADSQIGQLSDLLANERAAHQRALDEQWGELTGKHASELEEQHSWYLSQLGAFERDRDHAVEGLTAQLDTSLSSLREQQREALGVERESLNRAVARLQAEQASALDALANASFRDLSACTDAAERERAESASRLAEDEDHRARVNQADLRRLEQHTADMRKLLVAEREQWATREAKARAHGEEVVREVRDAAYEQATVEHDRVLREAAAQGAELTAQHEAALAAALAQKDEQLGARLAEYEGQLARMVTERAALQASTRDTVSRAALECDAARAELRLAQEGAEKAVAAAVSKIDGGGTAELRDQHERLLASQRQIHAEALKAVQAQAVEGQRAMLARLEEIQREASARHRHSAVALGEAVKALHVRRESELGNVAAEHATALGWLREEYETQLRRQAKLGDEVLAAERAVAEQKSADASAAAEAKVAQLETEKKRIAEEKAKGWSHLPLPDLLRQAMDEGLSQLRQAHKEEIDALLAEHEEEMESIEKERDAISDEAQETVTEAQKVAENELALALGEAHLQHEEERTRLMEELNTRAGAELAALRQEQEELARRQLASESKRLATEEQARVASEIGELKKVIGELEAENARAAEMRRALAQDADGALAAEVERLSAEVRTLRARAVPQPTAGAAPGGGFGKPAAPPLAPPLLDSEAPSRRSGGQMTPPRGPPPRRTVAEAKAAKAPSGRAPSRGRG